MNTLNARMQDLRRSLGDDPDGNPYVPRRKTGQDPYHLATAVQYNWTRFLKLVERALPTGPVGLPDLEKALTLVRGRPDFDVSGGGEDHFDAYSDERFVVGDENPDHAVSCAGSV
ncbi:hypothetical protein RKD31_000918 [Streptomyces sp. SAI-163]